MSITNLPLELLEIILKLLDVPALRAISTTCKSLHYPANRFLYPLAHDFSKNLDDLHKSSTRLSMLEIGLCRNPQNAKYIRKHTGCAVHFLRFLWEETPLNLSNLNLNMTHWIECRGDDRFERALSAKHPDTVIEEISATARFSKSSDKTYLCEVFYLFLGSLHEF